MRWRGSGEKDAAHSGAGEIIRRLHWRAWDPHCAAPDVSVAEMMSVLPVLVESGSVGMVWPRLRAQLPGRFPADGAVGAALEAAFRSQEAHNADVARDLGNVVSRLQEHSVEPVLIKGLAVARLFPAGHPAVPVRAAGDIDLVVRDEDFPAARAALEGVPLSVHGERGGVRPASDYGSSVDVDLHRFSTWGEGGSAEGFFGGAERVQIGRRNVLVPCAEDHLRVLCLHFLRHAAVRPLRLCDVALLMKGGEASPGGHGVRPYDWDRVLCGTAREVERIGVVLRLAEVLLGAFGAGSLPDALPGALPGALPDWLIRAVLRQWAVNPVPPGPALGELLAARSVGGVVRTVTRRWPDPITATMRSGARFDARSRRPVEVAAFVGQMGFYARRTFLRQVMAHLPGGVRSQGNALSREGGAVPLVAPLVAPLPAPLPAPLRDPDDHVARGSDLRVVAGVSRGT